MFRLILALALLALPMTAKAETVRLYAAGSLKAALADVARAFEAKNGGLKVELEFAASGLLRERIEQGAKADVFASADLGHPTKLMDGGYAKSKVLLFARNQLCALVREGLKISPNGLLKAMLDPAVRLATSTPKADPSGDYAFALFAKADSVQAGARSILEGKALQLTGGPTSQEPPAGRNQYAWIMASGKADVFLTYCTNAILAQRELTTLQIVQIPPQLNMGADYGLIVLKDAPMSATLLAHFILGEEGQAMLAHHGFGRGNGLQN
jgi:molybdate transport system substrate-binding protein